MFPRQVGFFVLPESGGDNMPISYRCQRCGKSIAVGKKCDCIGAHKTDLRYKSKVKEDIKEGYVGSDPLYHSTLWKRLCSEAKELYTNMDIYSWYKYGRIEAGLIVHHIIPIKDDYSKRLDLTNLIYLTDANHKAIHALYEESEEKKAEVQQELFNMIRCWQESKRCGFSQVGAGGQGQMF